MATLVTALAVLLFVTPSIAVTFAPSKTAVYCLIHAEEKFAPHDQAEAIQPGGAYHHEVGAMHSHGDEKSACCGLFGVMALVPGRGQILEPELSRSAAFSAIEASFHSLMPGRPDRPPISLLWLCADDRPLMASERTHADRQKNLAAMRLICVTI